MGLWGAAQAFAFGTGGFLGTLASDIARYPAVVAGAVLRGGVRLRKRACLLPRHVMAVWVHRVAGEQLDRQGDLRAVAVGRRVR